MPLNWGLIMSNVGHIWKSCIRIPERFQKSPQTYTSGVEMCMKKIKRNNKSSWVYLIETVYSIEGEGCSGKTVPRRFLFLKQ